jgi:ABC-2 type transport system permease protein
MRNAVTQLRPYLAGPAEYLIPAGLGIFFATATSIACTAFSRDAKSLPLLKSLPLQPRDIIAAKLVHALIFAALALRSAQSAGPSCSGRYLDAIVALLLSISGALALTMAGLAIDTFWPRLSWKTHSRAQAQSKHRHCASWLDGAHRGAWNTAVTLPSAKYTFAIFVWHGVCRRMCRIRTAAFPPGPKRLRQMEP